MRLVRMKIPAITRRIIPRVPVTTFVTKRIIKTAATRSLITFSTVPTFFFMALNFDDLRFTNYATKLNRVGGSFR
jgi:hypothetical protein